MSRVLVLYGSRDGHTALIAHRIADHLRAAGHQADVRDVRALPSSFSPRVFDAVVVGAPVRWGRHPRPIRDFAQKHAAVLARAPSWFFSVSLEAAAGPQGLAQAAAKVERFCAETGWTPERSQVLAGALPYTGWGFFYRQLIRLSAKAMDLPTDTSRDHDLTDWAQVRAFARELDRRIRPEAGERGEWRALTPEQLADAPAQSADEEAERAARARAEASASASAEHTTIPDAQYQGEQRPEGEESEAETVSSAPLHH